MNLLLRIVLVLAGLVVGASALVVFVLLLALWGARAGWAKLTGRPVTPFVARMHPFGPGEMMRRSEASRTPRADSVVPRRPARGDVTDVEARPPSA
jgi:hypothetical protein